MTKKLYIETVGCQMNVLDSELVVGTLRRHGYQLTHQVADADVIFFNTCSVREHAEDKVYSALGRLRGHMARHPHKVLGVLGCMAQKDQELILKRAPFVDIICRHGPTRPVARTDRAGQGVRRGSIQPHPWRGTRRRATTSTASFESFDPIARPEHAAHALPGVRPHADRLRQVLHLLRRAQRRAAPSRSGPPNTSSPRSANSPTKAARKLPCWARPSTAIATRTATADRRASATCSRASTTSPGIERIKFVTNFPQAT